MDLVKKCEMPFHADMTMRMITTLRKHILMKVLT